MLSVMPKHVKPPIHFHSFHFARIWNKSRLFCHVWYVGLFNYHSGAHRGLPDTQSGFSFFSQQLWYCHQPAWGLSTAHLPVAVGPTWLLINFCSGHKQTRTKWATDAAILRWTWWTFTRTFALSLKFSWVPTHLKLLEFHARLNCPQFCAKLAQCPRRFATPRLVHMIQQISRSTEPVIAQNRSKMDATSAT